jgi:hypothetical protein
MTSLSRGARIAATSLILLLGGCGDRTRSTPAPDANVGGPSGGEAWPSAPLPDGGISFSVPSGLLDVRKARLVLEASDDGVVRLDSESSDLFESTGGYGLAIVCALPARPRGDGVTKDAGPPGPEADAPIDLGSARLAPARVSALDDQGAFPGLFTLEIPRDAAKDIRPGTDHLIIFAPDGTTATQIQCLPPLVRFDEASLAAYLATERATEESQRRLAEKVRNQAQYLSQSINNIKQIGIAMHNYADAIGHFPPAVVYGPDGKPWHSWRVLVPPYLEQTPIYNKYRFDEPWDGPNNSKLLDPMPDVYRMPGDTSHFTHYVVPVGPNVAFLAEGATVPDKKGSGAYAQPGKGYRSIAQFTDGTSNTIIAGTVLPDRKIPWMKPDDLPITLDPKSQLASPALGDENGFGLPYKSEDGPFGPFLFGDGSVRSLHQSINRHVYSALLTPNGGEVVSSDQFGAGKTTIDAAAVAPVFRVEVVPDGKSAKARLREVPKAPPLPARK